MGHFVFVIEIVGTIAFALSGAITALKKHMDILGVTILGLTTAVGGGAIRDIVLGKTPPAMFLKPIYALVAVCVSIVIFIPTIRHLLTHNQRVYEVTLRFMDSLGLGIFTVMGINAAKNTGEDYGMFLLVFVGVITGVGGGVLRDVMAGDMPYIFVKHVYASASIVGALLTVLLWDAIGSVNSMFIGAVVVLVIRLLAAHFKWSLPHAKD